MKQFLIALLLFTTAFSSPVFAKEERIDHYDPGTPANTEEAIRWIEQSMAEVKTAFGNNKLEAIHEQSYRLEASVDFLREHAKNIEESLIDALDESVQIIHFASEKGEKEIVSKELPELEQKAKNVVGVLRK